MVTESKFSFIIAVTGVLLLSSCAQQIAPSGGPVDILPPQIIRSNPENFSTNFTSKTIEIEFDEYIRLEKIQENLIVSPVLKYDPEFTVKGKKLLIELTDTLRENATYVINFNEAIVDITERNPLSGFQYVFSTGEYVDSLDFSGMVLDAFDLTPQKNVLVMLYENNKDSVPYKELPRYLSRTKEGGTFNIPNIKAGNYLFFALDEENRNYLFDTPKEGIAFNNGLISVPVDSGEQFSNYYLFRENKEKQYLSKYNSNQHGKFSLIYNLPVKDFAIKELKGRLDNRFLIKDYDENQDSLVFWIKPPTDIDSLLLELTEGETKDTINLLVPKKTKALVELKLRPNAGSAKLDLNDSLIIRLDRPSDIDTSKIQLISDSTEIPLFWVPSNRGKSKFSAFVDWEESKSYQLIIRDSAFTDLYSGISDSMQIRFTTRAEKDYGTLSIAITKAMPGDILELRLQGKVVDTAVISAVPARFYFPYLKAGEYGLKIIHDRNGNGEWDTGNYLQGIQPEKVTIYPGTITIRANWDQEVEWIVK